MGSYPACQSLKRVKTERDAYCQITLLESWCSDKESKRFGD